MDPHFSVERRFSDMGKCRSDTDPMCDCKNCLSRDHRGLLNPENTSWIAGKNEDDVNHPSHYCNRSMEAIDIIEMIIGIEKNPMVAYNMSNVLKYLLRFRDKGTPVKDLEKAVWYLNRMIDKVKSE